jgi:hypothetical protein
VWRGRLECSVRGLGKVEMGMTGLLGIAVYKYESYSTG